MIFSSFEFIFWFLPVFLCIYYITPVKYRNLPLFAGSLCFYAFGEPVYVVLILFSLVVNYLLGILIADRKRKGWYLFLALFYNFGMLFFFKYTNFFIHNINEVSDFAALHFGYRLGHLENIQMFLPLGISFYTFKIVSYIADVYRKKTVPARNLIKLGTYLCMFPQLLSGPIETYSEMSKELESRNYSLEKMEDGLKLFTLGLGSKVLIANTVGNLWNDIQVIGFEGISTPLAWIGAFTYSLQIFFDFNGYSLMAIGLGKMLGFTIPKNFDQPYLSKSITEFWRRWHITLGNWFKEYLYIPLGGSRQGKMLTIRNLFLVWFATGFWHGAGWNFVIWGMFLFIMIVLEKLFLKRWLDRTHLFSRIYMLFVIPISWMIFAIEDLKELLIYFKRLFPFLSGTVSDAVNQNDFVSALSTYAPFLTAAVLLCTPFPSKWYQKYRKSAVAVLLLFAVFWLSIYQILNAINNPFLYFQF